MVSLVPGLARRAISKAPGAPVVITPVDGWGFAEAIDGKLAPPFELRLTEVGVNVGSGIRGWRGEIASVAHKYAGMRVQMSPRYTEGARVVVIWVFDEDKTVFSGMAETTGLERKFK